MFVYLFSMESLGPKVILHYPVYSSLYMVTLFHDITIEWIMNMTPNGTVAKNDLWFLPLRGRRGMSHKINSHHIHVQLDDYWSNSLLIQQDPETCDLRPS